MYWQVGLIGTRAFDRSGRVQYIDEAETEYFHRVYGELRHLHLMRSIVQTTKGASGFSTTLQDVFTKEWDMSARKVIMQGVSPGRGKGGKGGAYSTVRLLLPGAALMGEKRVSGLALLRREMLLMLATAPPARLTKGSFTRHRLAAKSSWKFHPT